MTITTVATTGSTNADLLAAAAAGAPEGTWLRAERQSGGRGRLGRTWASPAGNLHASTIVRIGAGDPPAPTLALVAGVALHQSASDHAGADGLRLKWPNDLLAGDAKLAGILLERAGDAVVIGFGVNLAHAPELPDRPVTSLGAIAAQPPSAPDAFLGTLAEVLSEWIAIWRRAGLAPVRAAWLERAHPVGTPLRAAYGQSVIEGTFDGLSPDGALLLRQSRDRVATIHAGDVFLI